MKSGIRPPTKSTTPSTPTTSSSTPRKPPTSIPRPTEAKTPAARVASPSKKPATPLTQPRVLPKPAPRPAVATRTPAKPPATSGRAAVKPAASTVQHHAAENSSDFKEVCQGQVKVNADVRCVARVGNNLWEGSRDGSIHIRDWETGEETSSMRAQNTRDKSAGDKFFVNAILCHGKATWVADSVGCLRSYTNDGKTLIHSVSRGTQAGVRALVSNIDLYPDLMWAAGEDWNVHQMRTQDAFTQKIMTGHKTWVNCLAVDNVYQRVWSGSEDGVRVWTTVLPFREGETFEQTESGESKDCLTLLKHPGTQALEAVDQYVWSGGSDKQITVWRALDMKQVAKFKAGPVPVTCIKVIGREVFTCGMTGQDVLVWARNPEGQQLRTIKLPSKTKIVDMVQFGTTCWFGGRSPGFLLRYKVTPQQPWAPYTRADGGDTSQLGLEERVFSRFVDWKLGSSEDYSTMTVKNLCSDLPKLLGPLLEILAEEEVLGGQHNLNASTPTEKLECVTKAWNYLSTHLKLDMSPNDIVEGDRRAVCNLLWELIRKYHIRLGYADNTTQQALLKWVNTKLEPYDLEKVMNWGWAWYDGKALSALTDHLQPGLIDVNSVNPEDPKGVVEHAINTASSELAIPQLLDAEDIVYCPDPRAIMTYTACFRAQQAAVADPATSYVSPPANGEDWGTASAVKTGDEKAQPVQFTVFAMDTDGAPVAKTSCQVHLFDAEGKEVRQVDVRDNKDGTFTCSYESSLPPGSYVLCCLLDGKDVSNSPVEFQVKNLVDPAKSYAEGPGLTAEGAGSKGCVPDTQFQVFARDVDGKPVLGSELTVQFQGPEGPVDVQTVDNGDGTFSASYDGPLPPGDYQMKILLDGHPVKNSPVAFTVLPLTVDIRNCYAEGPGLTKEGAASKAGTTEFKVYALDEQKNPVAGCQCGVVITGPNEVNVPVEIRTEDWSVFTVSYRTPLPHGQYSVECQLEGENVPRTPVVFIVPKPASALHSFARGPGLTSRGARGKDTGHFEVFVCDEDGNMVQGAEKPTVTMTGPKGNIPVTIAPSQDGKFLCSYVSPVPPGTYTINIGVEGKPIPKSPIVLNVGNCIDASKCSAEGPGLIGEGAREDKKLPFTVFARDAQGKPVLDALCQVTLKGAGEEIPVTIVDNGDGTFNCSYNAPLKFGEYRMDVLLDGQPIHSSPFTFSVKKGANANNCTAKGPGLVGETAGSNPPSYFHVYCLDDEGKKVSLIPTVKVKAEGPNGPVDVNIVHEGQGQFKATYAKVLTPGCYSVTPMVNGAPIDGAPIKFEVPTLADPARSYCTGPGLKNGVKMNTGFTNFDVFSVDRQGRPLASHNDLVVSVLGPDGKAVPVEISPGNKPASSHFVMYKPTQAGKHEIHVGFGTHQLQKFPMTVQVNRGASGHNTSGLKFEFTVIAATSTGELKTTGGDRWEVAVEASDSSKIEVKTNDHKNGSYSAKYDLRGDKLFTVTPCFNGEELSFAPFTHDLRRKTESKEGKRDDSF